jgi:hypothetical protein
MPLNGHYSGRLTRAVKRTVEKATGRDGKFYEIFNKHNFYDVDDPNNNLTKEQRMQVPRENQTRFTQFSSAIAEMFAFVLADAEYGLLTKDVQNIVDKLDVRASANKASLDGMGNVFKASASVPVIGQILAGAEASSKAMESLTTSVMGTTAFNPDLIPPIALGFPGLPAGVANTYKPGFFQPNWDFMYEQETGKSNSLWVGPDGYYRLGANISLYEGGERFQLFLKTIWGVAGVDKNLNPVGDVKGGLSPSDYDFLKEIGPQKGGVSTPELTGKVDAFTITDDQMRSSFFRFAQLKMWDVINNRRNWAHGHWGQLTHNSIPEYVKTAVSSYIWTVGLALDAEKNSEASLISYCAQMGLCYLVGYQYKLEIWGIDGVNKKLSEDGEVIDIEVGELEFCEFGVPKDEDIAKRYFTWIADLLVRSTNNSSGDEIALPLRRRRIAEANLIYRGQGQPVIEFGKEISQLPFFHQTSGLLERNFDKIVAADYNRYKNEGAPGGEASDGSIQQPESFKSKLEFGANEDVILPGTKNFVRTVMDQAGVTYGYVTSTIRKPNDQARAMFNNLQNGNVINYSSKANKNKGWGATLLYYEEKKNKRGQLTRSYSRNAKVTDAGDIAVIKAAMTDYISNENSGGRLVSKHCGDPSTLQVMDISPKAMRPQSRRSAFVAIMRQKQKEGLVRSFITPEEGDPAYHVEITIEAAEQFAQSFPNAALPAEPFNVRGNVNLNSQSSWLAPLSKDYIMSREASDTGSGGLLDAIAGAF